jgi:DNA-binding transcriptional ArsR family regulator
MFVQERAGNGQLLSAERRRAILDALERDGKVVAARLVEQLGVSEDTVRRDLRELASHGLVQRVHGGALPPAPQPGSFEHRRETFGAEKAALAEAAVGLLADADVVLLDGSTTNLELARRLPADRARTVLTNSPPITTTSAGSTSARRSRPAPPPSTSSAPCAPTPACSASARCTPRPGSRPTTSRRPTSSARWSRRPRT